MSKFAGGLFGGGSSQMAELRAQQAEQARLIAGALRDGSRLALLQLRDSDADETAGRLELLSHPDLAPGILEALAATLDAEQDY